MTTHTQLERGLKPRHLTMMGLGSAIGAGLFLGTGVGIQAAGPAILLAYLFAGAIVVLYLYMLGELAAARPASGSFSVYAEQAFGHWAGFVVGWLYWFVLVMVMGAEMAGASKIMAAWFGVEPWIPALVCVVSLVVVNLAKVRGFGEFEFWFALIKVAVIVVFLIIGTLLIFGLLPGTTATGLSNLTAEGFAPNGLKGIATGLLAVAFAFGGIELLTIAAAESENPAASIASAVRTVMWRISVFYLGSVLIIICLMPYASIAGADTAAESPFAIILGMANIPGVVGFMEAVIVLSLLSAFNAQIYGTSRLVYSFALRGDAPRIFGRTNHQGVPMAAVLSSMFFAFCSVGLMYWNPPGLLTFLLNAVGGGLLIVWITIAATWLKLHPELKRNGELTTVKVPWHPWPAVLCLVMLGLLIVLMLTDTAARSQVTSVLVVAALFAVASFFTKNKVNPDTQSAAQKEVN